MARKYAYQILVVDELEHCGVEIVFLNHELGRSPEDDANLLDETVPWLECDPEFTSVPITYLTGFQPGAKSAFVHGVVGNVY